MTRTHLNKLGRDLILDILNKTNASDITFAEVDFSTPEVVAGAGMNRNTTVLVTALPNGRYKGERRVYYWRLPIQQVISEEYRRFPMLGMPTNTLMIAQEINTRYNLRLTAEDIHVDPISVLEKPFNVTIRTKPGSYAFLGEVTMQIVEPAIDLSDVITVNLLEGLYYPDDVVYTLGGLNFVQPGNGLLHVGGVNDTGIWVGNNAELEIGTGFRLNGVTNSLAPAGGNNYTHLIGEDWSVIASLELLDDTRGDNLISLYDVTLQVIHENGGDVEMFLRRDEVTNTLYFETNHGPSTRLPMLSAPGDWGLIKLQTLVPIGQIRNGFINLDYTGNVAAGRFTVIMEAKAKGTVLSPAIRIENTIMVTRETTADAVTSINVSWYEVPNNWPLIFSIEKTYPNGDGETIDGQTVSWWVTNSAGRSVMFSGLSQFSEFYADNQNYADWYNESPQITITATMGVDSYTIIYDLAPPPSQE